MKHANVHRLTNQILIKIDWKTDKKFFIVIDLEKEIKEAYFTPRSNCKIIITQERNEPARRRLYFQNESEVQRVRLVPEFKKLFWITETGILISRRTYTILSQHENENGYLVHASRIGGRDGKAICPRIHQLVASAFVDRIEGKPVINHKDGNKKNNNSWNLEWTTQSENVKHALRLGLSKIPIPRKFSDDQVRQIRQMNRDGIGYKTIAKLFGLNDHSIIYQICRLKSYKEVV